MERMDTLQNQESNNLCRVNDIKPGQFLTYFQKKLLEKSLQEELPEQYRLRIEIMLLADEGKTQTQICKTLGCSQGTARHWMIMARSGFAHHWNDHPIGRPKTINEQYVERLKELVIQNPRDLGYPFRRWTAQWLCKHLAKEFDIKVSSRHVNRLLKEMGLSTRPKPVDTEAESQNEPKISIVIRDLHSVSTPESSLSVWSFSSIR